METWQLALSVIGLGVVIILAIAGAVWKVAQIVTAIRGEIEQHRKDTDAKLVERDRGWEATADRMQREVGETFTAIRQKITEVELFSRDNFVRVGSFKEAMSAMSDNIRILGDRVETRLIRMETKIDQKT